MPRHGVRRDEEIVGAADRVKLDGDFRYRYERIDVEGSDTRSRNRIRARTNITAEVADNIDVGFGLATGGDDPVSSNQTLGGGGSSKSIALNLAYVDWEATDGLHLFAALKFQRDWYFINAFGSYLESDSGKSNDSFAWGGQFGATGQLGDVKLMGGLGYYSIEAAGKSTTFGDPADPGDFLGNTAIEPGGLACGTPPSESEPRACRTGRHPQRHWLDARGIIRSDQRSRPDEIHLLLR